MQYFIKFHKNESTKVSKKTYECCVSSISSVMASLFGLTELESRNKLCKYIELIGEEKNGKKIPTFVFDQWSFLETYL